MQPFLQAAAAPSGLHSRPSYTPAQPVVPMSISALCAPQQPSEPAQSALPMSISIATGRNPAPEQSNSCAGSPAEISSHAAASCAAPSSSRLQCAHPRLHLRRPPLHRRPQHGSPENRQGAGFQAWRSMMMTRMTATCRSKQRGPPWPSSCLSVSRLERLAGGPEAAIAVWR